MISLAPSGLCYNLSSQTFMQPNRNRIALLLSLLAVIAGVILIVWLVPRLTSLFSSQRPADQVGYDSSTVRAEVLEILETGQITLGERPQRYQVFTARVLEAIFPVKLSKSSTVCNKSGRMMPMYVPANRC